MRLLALADLHLDHWTPKKRDPLEGSEELISSADLLVLAGDASDNPKRHWKNVLARLDPLIDRKRVIFLPGNHDYWYHRLDADDRLRALAKDLGADFAQEETRIFGKLRIHFATLWTDFALLGNPAAAKSFLHRGMNDYRYIRLTRIGFGKIRPDDVEEAHHRQRRFLTDALAERKPGETHVVITHHGPVREAAMEAGGTIDKDYGPAYASDLSALIAAGRPDLWIFGHTHRPYSGVHGQTSIRNVSLGRPSECPDPAARIRQFLFNLPE